MDDQFCPIHQPTIYREGPPACDCPPFPRRVVRNAAGKVWDPEDTDREWEYLARLDLRAWGLL